MATSSTPKTQTSPRKPPPPLDNAWLRLLGVLLLPISLFPLLSLASYNWHDIGRLHSPPNNPPDNLIGPVGAWFAYGTYMYLGLAAWLLPVWALAASVALMTGHARRLGRRVGWGALAMLCLCCLLQLNQGGLAALCGPAHLNNGGHPGGIVGHLLMTRLLVHWLSPVGAGIVMSSFLLLALVMVVGPANIVHGISALVDTVRNRYRARMDHHQQLEAEGRRLQRKLEDEQKRAARDAKRAEREQKREQRQERKRLAAEEKEAQRVAYEERKRELAAQREREAGERVEVQQQLEEEERQRVEAAAQARLVSREPVAAADEPEAAVALPDAPPARPYELPPINLLDLPPSGGPDGSADTSATSAILVETLAQFGLEVEVTHVERGPVVTRYELLPAPGIRVERIARLSNNLELALKATSVRVQAPIPGKGVVGVEVPNDVAKMVTAREVLEGQIWRSGKAEVPLILGKDVGGHDLVVDLAKMPHLLIAGATGAGKSVCINALLAGLLMCRTPEELRLMLVDPKIVEFAMYNELPHLVVPVITDPAKVSLGLRWAITEMEKRYKLFARVGVRNIASYNKREITTQPDMFEGGDAEAAAPVDPEKLPYIVIVIDELADLMLVAGAEIENSIARLAQLSRAVGIHMILATQRPSVNVITGTIKANFPGRVAFQVAQKVDSRTILDAGGAESLIGRGDMLFLNPRTSKLVRAQGALISDAEIERVVDFIKAQSEPVYDSEVKASLERAVPASDGGGDGGGGGGGNGASGGGDADDGLLEQAVEIIRETHRASTSSLQRRLRIGYTRAARLIDVLEERGIIGPPRGSEPREILIDLDGEIPNNDPSVEIE